MNSIITKIKMMPVFIFAAAILAIGVSLQGCGEADETEPVTDETEKEPDTVVEFSCTEGLLAKSIDFDCDGIDYAAKVVGGDGAVFSVIDNPELSGSNSTTSKVGQITNNGATWEHIKVTLDNPVDFSVNRKFTMSVYSTQSLAIKLKFEAGTNGDVETDANHGGSGWEDLTFNLSASGTYNEMVIFVDGPGTSAGTFYIDNIAQVAGGSGLFALTETIDFETDGFGATWDWNVFENGSNPPLDFVANPSASGINTSETVAKITALSTGAAWVGTESVHGEMGLTWDLSASNAFIKIMVYKSVISDVGMKLANAAGGAQVEIKVANTKVNEWEELTFDFSSRIGNGLDGSTAIDQIVVFPDFRDGRSSDVVVYFDNITFGAE